MILIVIDGLCFCKWEAKDFYFALRYLIFKMLNICGEMLRMLDLCRAQHFSV